MKRSPDLFLVLWLAVLLGLPGCLVVAAGAVAAGVVYATGNDSSEVYFDRPMKEVFDAAAAELQDRGTLAERDPARGRLSADLDDASVTIDVVQATSAMVRVSVSARKLHGVSPAPDLAETIARAIARRLGPAS